MIVSVRVTADLVCVTNMSPAIVYVKAISTIPSVGTHQAMLIRRHMT
jgi:hypothetical protein